MTIAFKNLLKTASVMRKKKKLWVVTFFILTLTKAQVIDIDGNWSPWSNLETPCLKRGTSDVIVYCGGGVRKRYRSCTNPTKQGNGLDCEGQDQDEFPCNTHMCQLPRALLWSAWGSCSKSCGHGVRKRHAMCGTIRDKPEEGHFELEYEEPCQSNQFREQAENCNTWDKQMCPGPCLVPNRCPTFSKCIDVSDEIEAKFTCECQLGTVMHADGSGCYKPAPTTPTTRPPPTLPPAQKVVANVITRSASTIIIAFLGFTLGLFIFLGIFDSGRVIHMNMELALISAHICFLPTSAFEDEEFCRVLSILSNFFFIACFIFMLLESIHMYAIVAWVVPKNGLLSRSANVLGGWGVAFVIVLFNICFEYENFGGDFHCFLRLDSGLIYGIYVPIIMIVILTFSIVEAAGAGEKYEKLPTSNSTSEEFRTSAKVMQRSLLFILPLVFASYVVGTMAEHGQNLYLYSVFTLLNGIVGGVVFFFHASANETMRRKLKDGLKKICGKKQND